MGLGKAGTNDILNILNDVTQHLADFICF